MLGIGADQKLPTVLLIDDDMVSREVVATVLTMSGYTVHTAENGAESLTLLDGGSCSPDVILMDTQMPGISGIALMTQLRTRSHATLYAISGTNAPAEVVNAADGFLLKPFGPEALLTLLRNHATDSDPGAAAELPILNHRTLTQLRALMPEPAVQEIFTAMMTDLEKRELALRSAIDRGDTHEIRRIGHSIKGGCGMAGAMQAARLGEKIEARGDDLEYSRGALVELQAATLELKRMLDSEFSPQGNAPAK